MSDFLARIANLSPKRLALLALEQHDELEAIRKAAAEPIAIVGIGCRFPGGAENPDSFWRVLRDGVDTIGEIPADRWDVGRYYDPDPEAPGKMYTKYGAFLREVDRFDAHFFAIAPREAAQMDPQQRLVLEVAWEALEHAGQSPAGMARTPTGVFIGVCAYDYSLLELGDPGRIETYSTSGAAPSILANRLSYLLDLQGPSLTVDTACSSSLVTVHLACQSLRRKECDAALAGGVNLMLSPVAGIGLSKGRMLAADGRCKTFDAAADGYVRGEGCGLLVLKRLSDALASRDSICGLIRGSAVNQDGYGNGLTAPNLLAQQAVIRQALENARVNPEQVGYIEAHGTGTALGDPIEVEALRATYGQPRPGGRTCSIASVKTNIGHLEGAAGIAGLIKVVLALHYEAIPPHLHFKQLNPHISLEGTPFVIPTGLHQWPRTDAPRYAAVSSFGFGGTNAHIILSEAPSLAVVPASPERPLHLLSLSAKSEPALKELARRYLETLDAPSLCWPDVCFTANAGRSHHSERLATLADSAAAARDQLAGWLEGETPPGVLRGKARGARAPKVAFLFTGQGAQYTGMGRRLYETSPAFRAALDRCSKLLESYLQHPLLSVLYPEPGVNSPLDQTAYTQPALFALEYGLAELWASWGVMPGAVLGHSVGEYAAACVAGVFSLEDALKLVVTRARLMQALPANGAMEVVFADERKAVEAIGAQAGEVAIAALNSPTETVLSGATAAIQIVVERLHAQGIQSRPLSVSHAFHSPLMDPVLESLESAAAGVALAEPRIGFISNLTGRPVERGVLTQARYWRRHARQPVRFAAGIGALYAQGYRVFLEIGPQPVLLGTGRQCLPHEDAVWLPSLRRGKDDWQQLLASLGTLYVQGVNVDWRGFDAGFARRRLPLPTYPFQRQQYALARPEGVLPSAPSGHPLPGRRLRSASQDVQFEIELNAGAAYVRDHRIFGEVVMPGAAYLMMMAAAAEQVFAEAGCVLEDVIFRESLGLSEASSVLVQTILTPAGSDEVSFRVASCTADAVAENAQWRLHASGRMSARAAGKAPAAEFRPEIVIERCPQQLAGTEYYQRLARTDIEIGPSFQCLDQLWRRDGEGLGRMRPADPTHPGILDSCIQVLGAALPGGSPAYLPVHIETLRWYGPADRILWSHARLRPEAAPRSGAVTGDLHFYDSAGQLVAEVAGLSLARATHGAVPHTDGWLYEIQWQPQSLPEPANGRQPGAWLILADRGGAGLALAELLEARGESCTLVFAGEDLSRLSAPDAGWSGVVHLWGLDAAVTDQSDGAALQTTALAACGSALHLVQALQALAAPPRLWLVTRGAQPVQAPLWGLGSVIALEHPELRCTRVDLDPGDAGVAALVTELLAEDRENQVRWRAGRRYVARLAPGARRSEDEPERLEQAQPGVLDSLAYQPAPIAAPGPGEIAIRVRATGVNFRDALQALGMYPGDPGPLGLECAGTVVALGEGITDCRVGDEVLALAPASFASDVITASSLAVPRPPRLTPAEAATIPVAFLTAAYALRHLARLQRGERVLIHAAAGGVGLAAVQIAQQLGAEIFATAGTPEKRAFLAERGVPHIFDSRSLDFAAGIQACTAGMGVDVVLNSLTGEFIPASLVALAARGRWVEIGKREIWTADQVAQVKPEAQYFPFDLAAVTQADRELIRTLFRGLAEEFVAGVLQPLPHQDFEAAKICQAFRTMAQARHIGKIVVTRDGVTISAAATYLVTGGLGALGLEVARWLVTQGARHVTLLGRTAPSAEARRAIQAMEQAGAHVGVLEADVANRAEMAQVIDTMRGAQPPLCGIVHAAGVLHDGVLLQQTPADFAEVLAPKVAGAWNLHVLTQGIPLDFLVLFSSMASLLGSPGQGNYAAANAFLDALAHYRRERGLPALSINWGPWATAGMAAAQDDRQQRRRAVQGVEAIPPEQALELFEGLLRHPPVQIGVLPVDWSHLLQGFDGNPPPLFEAVARRIAPVPRRGKPDLRQRLERVPAGKRQEFLLAHVREQAIKVLGLEAAYRLDPETPLKEIGLDSLMAVDLAKMLGADIERALPATLVFTHPTIAAVAAWLLAQIFPQPDVPAAVQQLSASEWEAFLYDDAAGVKEQP